MTIVILMALVFAAFLLAGAPVFVALGISAVAAFLTAGAPAEVAGQVLVSAMSGYALLAVPLFILMAEILNTGGMVQRLVRLLNAMVGHIPGGLGVVAVLTSAIRPEGGRGGK